MRRLKVVEKYVCREVMLPAGNIISDQNYDLDLLMRDASGCFQELEDELPKVEELVIKQPPVNKMIDESPVDKTPSEQPQEDDTELTKIVGIGATLQTRLNQHGYYTIEQLIEASDAELLEIQYMTKSIIRNIRVYAGKM